MNKVILLLVIFLFNIQTFGQTNRAVIVGLSEYNRINHIDEVEFCKQDAELFYVSLSNNNIAKNEDMLIFVDENATKFNILLGLITIIEQSSANDNLIFYFSGYIDVSALSDTNGYLLCYNATAEGFYSAGDAIRISTLKEIVELATEKGINVHMYFDIFSNNYLSGGFLGAQRTLFFIKEKWNNTNKLISRDSLQFSYNNNTGLHGYFTNSLEESIIRQNRDIDLLYINEDVINDVSKTTSQEQTPIEVYDNNVNMHLSTISYRNTNPFKYFYKIPQNLLTDLQNFKNAINDGDPSKIYSAVLKPYLVINPNAMIFNELKGRSCIAFSRTDSIIVGNTQGNIRVFSVKDSIQYSNPVNIHENWGIKTIAEYNKNIVITGAWGDNKIKITDISTNTILTELSQHTDDVEIIKLSADKKTIISGGADKKIIVWSIDSTFKVLNSVIVHEYPQAKITALQFINNTSFITGDEDGNTKYIEIIRNRPVVIESFNFNSEIVNIQIYKNNTYIACANGKIHIINNTSKIEVDQINIDLPISDIAISNFKTNDNFLFIGINRQFKIKTINLDDDTLRYNDIRTQNNIDHLVCINNNKLLALNETSGSTVISFKMTEPQSNSFSAFYYYKYMLNSNTLSAKNEQKLQFLLSASMLNYVDNIIYSFIAGKFIYPQIKDIERALYFIEFVSNLYSKYEVLNKKLKTQKLILEIYRNILYGNTQDLQNSIVLIDTLRQLAPYAVYPLNQLSQVHTELNNLTLAEQNIVLAAKSLPTWTETMVRKGRIYQKQGMYELAAIEYRKIIHERPDIPKGYIYLAQLYYHTNNMDSAWKYINIAQRKELNNEFILNQKVLIEFKKLDIVNAGITLKKAKSLKPSYKISIINEGKHFEAIGSYLRAEMNYEKLFGRDSSIAEPYYLLGSLYLKYGDVQKAETILIKGLSKFNDNINIILALADVYAFKFFNIQAEYVWGKKVLQLYNTAIEYNPYYYVPYAKKAHFFEKLFEYRKRNIIPNNVIMFNQADSINSKAFLDSIYTNLSRAKKFSPKNLDLLIEFSDYYYKNNNVDSLKKIEKHIKKLSNPYQNAYYSGRFYSVTKNSRKAYKYFKKLAKNNSEFEDIFIQMTKINLKNNNYKAFLKNKDKYFIMKRSPYLKYISTTISGLNGGRKSFSKPFKNYYIAELAINNVKYIRTQASELINEENWGYQRYDVIEETWITIKRNNKIGLMLFNGTILIPINFDSITHIGGNLFECKINNQTYTYEVNLISAKKI